MINVYCVLVKPSYNIKYVERLYLGLCKNLSFKFQLICLTDSKWNTSFPISFINVSKYELETWWNKLVMFSEDVCLDGVNLYFDLDVSIIGNIDFLLKDINSNKLYVVDTLWKDKNFVEFGSKQKHGKLYYCYGNTSVMGWKDKSQKYLFDLFMSNQFVTIDHFGDDTFLNQNAKIAYFKPLICHVDSGRYMKTIQDKRIIIHFKDPP